MVIHYTKENANAFAKNHGITEEQARIVIDYMDGNGYHLFDYDADNECRIPGEDYPFKLYRLEVNECAYKSKAGITAVTREPLYAFDGFLEECTASEAVMEVREWLWGMIDDDEYESNLQQLEADDNKLAEIIFPARTEMNLKELVSAVKTLTDHASYQYPTIALINENNSKSAFTLVDSLGVYNSDPVVMYATKEKLSLAVAEGLLTLQDDGTIIPNI